MIIDTMAGSLIFLQKFYIAICVLNVFGLSREKQKRQRQAGPGFFYTGTVGAT